MVIMGRKQTDVCVKERKGEFYVHVINFCKANGVRGRQNNLVNTTL